jgi:flagellar protein FlbD
MTLRPIDYTEFIMIRLTRLNHLPLILNSDLIEHIEETPDTVVTLTTGQIVRVRETAEQVVERIVAFRRRIFAGLGYRDTGEDSGGAGIVMTDHPETIG